MSDFLFELGTEEIPARFVRGLLADTETAVKKYLQDNALKYASLTVYGTDRRLAVLLQGLPAKQDDRRLELKGPPVKTAYADGKLTPAGAGW